MKFILTLLLGILTLNFSAFSQCEASFEISQSSGGWYFESTSGSPNMLQMCYWDFGDGNTSEDCYSVHNYAQDGVYTPCLIITTMDGCSSTACDTLVVGNSNTGQCGPASITYTQNGPNTFEFAVSANTPFDFVWDFGDGTSSNEGAPVHEFGPGVHTVCLTYICANGESGTECISIVVEGENEFCDVFILADGNSTASGAISFTAASSDSLSAPIYEWTSANGDLLGNTQTITLGLEPGTYEICVAALYANCAATDCIVYTVEDPQGSSTDICGTVSTGNLNDDTMISGTVYLVEWNDSTGILSLVDQQTFSPANNPITPGNYFCFENQAPGVYLVKAALGPNSALYADYLPTYYDMSSFWAGAQLVEAGGDAITLNMVPGQNPGGPGFIEGSVFEGAGKTNEIPVSEAQVMLLDVEGQALRYTMTDLEGYYSFEEVPEGDYEVMVEIIGKDSQKYPVSIESSSLSNSDVSFAVYQNEVEIIEAGSTSVIEELLEHDIAAFPNPTDGDCRLYMLSSTSAMLEVQVVSSTGYKISSFKWNVDRGINQLQLNSSNWASGTYYILVGLPDGSTASTTLIKL